MHLMAGIAWIACGAMIGIMAPWVYLRAKDRKQQTSPQSTPNSESVKPAQSTRSGGKPARKYAAVSIELGLKACPAALKLQGERFLSTDAPRLPLGDCDQSTCDCRYRKHDDRRSGDDRRDSWGRFGGFVVDDGNEKRHAKRDRRAKTPGS